MGSDVRWFTETEGLVAQALYASITTTEPDIEPLPFDEIDDEVQDIFRRDARAVLTALADVGLLADGPAAVHEGRIQASAAILAHADKHAPKDGNKHQRRMRRHLEIAARVAAPPVTLEEVAAALRDRFRDRS